jgi:hypothetical protein
MDEICLEDMLRRRLFFLLHGYICFDLNCPTSTVILLTFEGERTNKTKSSLFEQDAQNCNMTLSACYRTPCATQICQTPKQHPSANAKYANKKVTCSGVDVSCIAIQTPWIALLSDLHYTFLADCFSASSKALSCTYVACSPVATSTIQVVL